MSSTKNSGLDLNQLLQIVNTCYGEEDAILNFGWDMQNSTLRPVDTGDDLARFISSEIVDSFIAERSDLAKLQQVSVVLVKALDELKRTQSALHLETIRRVVIEFWRWFRKSGRSAYSEALLQAWIDVHDENLVRDMAAHIHTHMKSLLPETLTPEALVKLDEVLLGVSPAQPSPPPPPPAPTT